MHCVYVYNSTYEIAFGQLFVSGGHRTMQICFERIASFVKRRTTRPTFKLYFSPIRILKLSTNSRSTVILPSVFSLPLLAIDRREFRKGSAFFQTI